ncbi:glycosyltransferase [Solidesulfovibrio sp.]|uniref:glycosyltransferase family 2 protein n=1 Tax=Solidesulfovibrio sp. TaxID=2910990 RepID=UPI0026331AEB|nr:glycosyltransferase [Solidesulfovibrio sp.]
MKKSYTHIDLIYLVLVVVTALASGSAMAVAFGEEESLAFLATYDDLIPYASLGVGLSPLAAFLLLWRVWMAWRYASCPPAPDAALPVATVVIPAYNEGRQVLETIRSVMASDYPAEKLHILCIDDGSADDTWQWMLLGAKEFPTRLRLLRQPRNMGKRHALLAGFRQARGEVFVTIDSDCLVMSDTLRHLVSPFAASPRTGAVAGNVRVLNRGDGAIPKMLDVSFTMSFDFLRRGQGTYGGVLCTPGALSAYRTSALAPAMEAWAEQTFMGRPANIGEDRALTNIILGQGLRVDYQKDAVVLTNVPAGYRGLYRMLLRWARSNVRECLVMLRFLPRRFRHGDGGSGWVRLSGISELLMLPATEIVKAASLAGLCLAPFAGAQALVVGSLIAAAVPAVVYQFRERGLFGLVWGVGYCFFWVFGLSWITLWGLFTAMRSGWLTRDLEPAAAPAALAKESPDAA